MLQSCRWFPVFGFLLIGTVAAPSAETPSPRSDAYGDPLPDGAIVRLGTSRFRENNLSAAALSPDGRTLALLDDHNFIRLWDVPTGKVIRRFARTDDFTWGLMWSPDGQMLASVSSAGGPTIRLWDAATGKKVGRLDKQRGHVDTLAWSPDGKLLASGGDEELIRLWDVAACKEIRQLVGHGGNARSLTWSPDGKLLASGSDDKTVRLWEPASGKELRRFVGHAQFVRSVAFAPDGTTLASASEDEVVRLWDIATGKELHRLAAAGDNLAWSPDGKKLALGSWSGRVRVWEPATGKEPRTLADRVGRWCAWSPDGQRLATRRGNAIQFLDAATGRQIPPLAGHTEAATAVAWSPDGKTLASGSRDKTTRLWNTATGEEIRLLQGHRWQVEALAWSPNGKTLASGGEDTPGTYQMREERTLRLWDAENGKELGPIGGPRSAVRSLAFAPDGRMLASRDADQRIRLWETSTGKERGQYTSSTDAVTALTWSPDGTTLGLLGLDNTIRLWSPATGQESRQPLPPTGRLSAMALSPDGKTLATASDSVLSLWDTATGEPIRRFPGSNSAVLAVAWSPDGRTLAAAHFDKTVRLWEATSGEECLRLTGHSEPARCLAWSPDGTRLATGSWDTTVLIWAIRRHPEDTPLRLQAAALQSCWADLENGDAVQAHRALRTLSRGGGESVSFLAGQMKPARPADSERLPQLIADLESDRFAVRRKAMDELESLRGPAEPALRRALEGRPALDLQRRLEALLARRPEDWSREELRRHRAVAVLEIIGSADARKLLESLASGDPTARLTQDVKASLDRLNRRTAAEKDD